MQVSLSPETAAPLKTELAAISTTYLILSMPSWGTNTASPGGLSGYWLAAFLVPRLPQIGQNSYSGRDRTAARATLGGEFPTLALSIREVGS